MNMMLQDPDYMDKPGAEDLARRIRNYWARAGVTVRVWLETREVPGTRKFFYVVQSDIGNHLAKPPAK